jgi:uncharacterized delta-60 repeat protein
MKKFTICIFLLFSFSIALAQNAADVETSFGAIPGFNGEINSIVQQPDGKILVGGDFTKYKGLTCNYFVRLLSDGTVDNTLNLETTFWYGVYSIAIQPDGKILVGGGYSTPINGLKVGIIRLNSDGSTDYSFDAMEKFVGTVRVKDIDLQPDGKIFLIGGFSAYDSVSRNGIVRINSDGSLDTSFNPGTGFNHYLESLVIQPDGKMLIVGAFTNYNGYTRNRIIRLNPDASVDLTFNVGTGFNSTTTAILLQPDSKIVVGGGFANYKNVTQKNLIRLLTNGDKDTTLDSGAGFIAFGSLVSINDIKIDTSGNFIVGGQFSKYNNIDKINCVRLSSNGSLDNTFTFFTDPFKINSILIQNDQKIILGGDNYFARVNNNSSFDYTFDYGSGFNSSTGWPIENIIQPDGKIIVGGRFSLYGLHDEIGLIRLNSDGTKDTTFNIGFLDYALTKKILLQPDGKIILLGSFHSNVGNGANYNFIRLNADGSQDITFATSGDFYSDFDPVLQADGKILVCGGLQVRRLNSNGTVDSTFNTGFGFNYYVKSVAVQPDGKIIAVGDFSVFNGEQHLRIVRLLPNGSIDTTFNTGEGFNGTARTIKFQPDGKILVGGSFGSYNLISAWGVVRINTDGSYDSTFNTGFSINNVNSLAIQTDGKIIAGGYKSYFVNSYLTNLIRFNSDGSVDTTFDIGTGFDMGDTNSFITKINLQADGKILISGDFTSYKSVGSSNLIRLNGGNSVLFNEDFLNSKLTLFPNPTIDYINIRLPSENLNYEYQIIDLSGKTIIQNKSSESLINVQALSEGVYIIKVLSQQKEFISKFIKK